MKFEEYADLKGRILVNTLYHWESTDTRIRQTPLALKHINNKRVFYLCDNIYDWASPHLKDEHIRLYEVDVLTRKPLVLLNQYAAFEEAFRVESRGGLVIRKYCYDSVIYTAHEHSPGIRQMVLLYPKQQIIDVREVKDIDWDFIKRMRRKP